MASGPKHRERVARNFVERYGADRFSWLMDALASGVSGQRIADEFEVSRERVRQWKNTFGHVMTLYQVHPEVERVLRESAAAAAAQAREEAEGE